MTTCPDTEELAAFIDGKLAADSRASVVAHLVDCPSCYAVVSDGLTVREELAARSRSRMRRYAAYAVPSALAAAAVLLLVVRVWHPAQKNSTAIAVRETTRESTPQQAPIAPGPQPKQAAVPAPRSFAGDLTSRLARTALFAPVSAAGGAQPRPRTAFGFSSAVPRDKGAFRIGAGLTRLEAARQAKDEQTTEAAAAQLVELLKLMESSSGLSLPAAEGEDRFAGFSASIEAQFSGKKEHVYLALGTWVEAAGLAAAAGDAAFFRTDEIVAFRRELETLQEPIGTLNGLSRLETIVSAASIPPDHFEAITRLLDDIREMY